MFLKRKTPIDMSASATAQLTDMVLIVVLNVGQLWGSMA